MFNLTIQIFLHNFWNFTFRNAKQIRQTRAPSTQAIKGTLMQIWKYPYIFVFKQKQYPENFTFLPLRILELFTRKVCIF